MPAKNKKKVLLKNKSSKKKIIKKKVTKKKPFKKNLPKRKTIKRIPVKKKPAKVKKPKQNVVGKITHYFPKVRAAVIKVKSPISVGDNLKIKGHTTDFTQVISSMQIDRVSIDTAKKGDEIGLLVNSRVRRRDVVIKL